MKPTRNLLIATSNLRLQLALLLALVFALALSAMTRAATFTWDAQRLL